MRSVRPLVLGLVIAAAALTVVGANVTRFIGAKPVIRTKQFDFLPSPTVARILSCGHPGTVAKLRWIDSFAWFQWQLDHPSQTSERDGVSTVARLYQTLTALDPRFEPFYLHGSLSLSGVMGRPHESLRILSQGTVALPKSMTMWRNLVSELLINYKLEDNHPDQLAALLDSWAASVDPEQREEIWIWRNAVARRKVLGLDEVGYWVDRLRETPPGAPQEEYLIATARESAARLQARRLTALSEAAARASATAADIAELARSELISQVFPKGLLPGTPIADGRILPDPWGYPWTLTASGPVSIGMKTQQMNQRLLGMNMEISKHAAKEGRQPANADEALRWASPHGAPEIRGTWTWDGRQLGIDWETPPSQPWDPRKP